MDASTHSRLEARVRLIRALAHPSRLFMVEELARGERCVCELTELVQADISTVSKHLAVLRAAGIVRDHKRGVQVYYSLNGGPVLGFVREVDGLLVRLLEQQMDALKPHMSA